MSDLDPKEAVVQLDVLIEQATDVLRQVKSIRIDWSSLNWSKEGAASLFEQFRLAGSWGDFVTGQMLDLELQRNSVVGSTDGFRVGIDKALDDAAKAGAKNQILGGHAYQERAAFARIAVGDRVWDLAVLDKKLEHLNGSLAILKVRAKMFTDFKNDAKVAASLMNFGNQLGELR